jgi:tetratricopeptide (TPR) repeat protein
MHTNASRGGLALGVLLVLGGVVGWSEPVAPEAGSADAAPPQHAAEHAGAEPAAAESAEPHPVPPARVLSARSGETPRGATRLVFETSRPVEYLIVELPEENGFEVHLMETDAGRLPEPLGVTDARVAGVAFRAGPSGVVARVAGRDERLQARAFRLENPSRVVVDVFTASTAAAARAPAAQPAVAAKSAKIEPPDLHEAIPAPEFGGEALASSDAGHGAGHGGTEADPHVDGPEVGGTAGDARAEPADAVPAEDFEALLAWITGLKLDARALELSESEEERSRYRRQLGLLLAERGLVGEAKTLLENAVSSEGYDPATAFADSVLLAELHLESGDVDAASAIAEALSAGKRTAPERLQLARILIDCRFPDLARMHLEEAVPNLTGRPRVEAQLLLARAYWDRRDAAKAHDWVAKLTESKHTPPDLLGPALVLQADCLWAMERAKDAENLYRRALALTLTDEEASWATLQLGNLAHRAGRVTDAMDHYRRAKETWPETFYGAQAEWFLRVSERSEQVREAGVVRDRG